MSDKVKYGIQIVDPKTATGTTDAIYQQMKRDLGAVPEPVTLHSASQDLLAGAWMTLRESLLAGHVDHGLKQTIAATISELNKCPWCVDAHSVVMYAAGRGDAVKLVTEGKGSVDAKTQAIIDWAAASRSAGSAILSEPPFSPDDAPEIIGTALTFHYLNRMVNAVLVETFLPKQTWLSNPIKRVAGMFMKSLAEPNVAAGESLDFLPDAPLPTAFQWASASPAIASAFARFAAVIVAEGNRVLPATVREMVQEQIHAWDGSDPGLSRQWVVDAVSGLDTEEQAIAKLVLLIAFAPHQISDDVINDFRRIYPADSDVIAALAWGSFIATQQIGQWLSQIVVHQ